MCNLRLAVTKLPVTWQGRRLLVAGDLIDQRTATSSPTTTHARVVSWVETKNNGCFKISTQPL